jgi:lysophospholipid hydrolase
MTYTLCRPVLHIDSALEWMQVDAGQVIYREGEQANSFYMVIQGRLRSITERQKGGVKILGEFGQGDSVGELDCITASPRQSTLHAIRDSELARMPMTLFNAISNRHPSITIHITRIIASRVRKEANEKTRAATSLDVDGRNNFNLKVRPGALAFSVCYLS